MVLLLDNTLNPFNFVISALYKKNIHLKWIIKSMFNESFLCKTTCTISPIFTDCPLLFKNILKMKTNLSGLNDAKFQVKTCIQSILYISTFAEMEFLVIYGGHHYRYGFSSYLTALTINSGVTRTRLPQK